MNTISSSSGYSVSNSTNKGFSGMVSGMDTEDLVNKMLSGTQSKIDKHSSKNQVSKWKQNMYREVISKINKFQTKFFDVASSSSLSSNAFYNQMKSVSSSSAFRVSGNSTAISGDMRIKIDQLASSTRLEGKSVAGGNAIEGAFNSDAFNSRVSFNVAEQKVAILDDKGEPVLDADGKPTYTTKAAATINLKNADIDKIMKGEEVKIDVPYGTEGKVDTISFSMKDGKLTMYGGSRSVEVKASNGEKFGTTALGLEKLGLYGGAKNSPLNGTLVSQINPDARPKIEMSLDGIKKTIEMDPKDDMASFQKKLDDAFGVVGGQSTVKVSGTMSDFNLTTGAGRKLEVTGSQSGLDILSVKSGQSNTIAKGDTIGSVFGDVFDANGKATFKINGKSIEVSNTDTISGFMKKINDSGADVTIQYTESTNRFVMGRKSSGAGFDFTVEDSDKGLLSKVFGGSSMTDIMASDMYKAGTNAVIEVNGQKTERSTNNFTIDGLNFELLSITDKVETVTTTRDTESIIKGMQTFVDDYNTLIKELNGLLDAKTDYKDYPPLTDAQRKDMSKSEIDAWELKAQTGLLRGDSDISSFLSQMRLALYQKPEGSKLALFDFGIETNKDWKERGKLEINEDTLRKMVNSDPTALQELFTYSKTKIVDGVSVPDGPQGIATALKDIMKKTANTSSGSPGTLVTIAGVAGQATDSENVISREMTKMNDKIKALKVTYEKEKTRYWREFNNMEKVLANLSAQSGWLTQQFGG